MLIDRDIDQAHALVIDSNVTSRSVMAAQLRDLSVGHVKQRRIVFAARHYLLRLKTLPPCRFDVVTVEADQVDWLKAAFDAG